jgi:preprotein translocase subunit SecG
MQTVLIVVHLLIVTALIVTVLLQRSEGGALGIGGSSNSFFTGRGQANVLTRATSILAFLFFATSLALTVLATYNRAQKSVFEQPAPPPASAPANQPPQSGGSVLDQLKKMNQPETPPAPAPVPVPTPAPAMVPAPATVPAPAESVAPAPEPTPPSALAPIPPSAPVPSAAPAPEQTPPSAPAPTPACRLEQMSLFPARSASVP